MALWIVLVGCRFNPGQAASVTGDGRIGDTSGPEGDTPDDTTHDAVSDAFSGYSVRYNIGGGQVSGIDHPGIWLADTEPGGLCNCSVYPPPTGTTAINGTADLDLYDKLPYATPLVCAFPSLPAGGYELHLLFAETYRGNAPCVGGPGTRQMTITAEGTVIDPLFDLTATGGGCAVVANGVDGGGHIVDRTYSGVAVTDGTLNLTLAGNGINGILDAIEIVQTSSM